NEREMRLNLITAVDKIKDWGVLTFIIGESPWSKNSEFPSSYSKIESYVDGWIAMNYNINEEWERQLLVIKSRKKHEIKPIKFSIDKTGIVFE
ncbi:MAG: ATPase domain-containing protein, partial [Candidatus Anstonellales archaeon]